MNCWKQPGAKAHQGSSLMDLKAWNVFVSQSHLRVLSWSHLEAGCGINVIISKSPSNWLQVIVWAWTGSVCHEAHLLQWLCEDRGCVLCVEEARGRGVCGLGKHSSASFWLQGYCCPPSSEWDSVVIHWWCHFGELSWIFLMGTLKAHSGEGDKFQPREGELLYVSQIVSKRYSSCLTSLKSVYSQEKDWSSRLFVSQNPIAWNAH